MLQTATHGHSLNASPFSSKFPVLSPVHLLVLFPSAPRIEGTPRPVAALGGELCRARMNLCGYSALRRSSGRSAAFRFLSRPAWLAPEYRCECRSASLGDW